MKTPSFLSFLSFPFVHFLLLSLTMNSLYKLYLIIFYSFPLIVFAAVGRTRRENQQSSRESFFCCCYCGAERGSDIIYILSVEDYPLINKSINAIASNLLFVYRKIIACTCNFFLLVDLLILSLFSYFYTCSCRSVYAIVQQHWMRRNGYCYCNTHLMIKGEWSKG